MNSGSVACVSTRLSIGQTITIVLSKEFEKSKVSGSITIPTPKALRDNKNIRLHELVGLAVTDESLIATNDVNKVAIELPVIATMRERHGGKIVYHLESYRSGSDVKLFDFMVTADSFSDISFLLNRSTVLVLLFSVQEES